MRTDPNKDQGFKSSSQWQAPHRFSFLENKSDGSVVSNSFSGSERNHLYLNQRGKSFVDVSGLSGLDSIADGRSFAYLDYDQDGWLDVAVASANAPQFELFHNEIGPSIDEPRNQVSIRLVGGNAASLPSKTFSNRNGFGTKLVATLADGQVVYREHHCGAGMAAQNSDVIHLGLGSAASIEELEIIWPSGKTQTHHDVRPGSVHEFHE